MKLQITFVHDLNPHHDIPDNGLRFNEKQYPHIYIEDGVSDDEFRNSIRTILTKMNEWDSNSVCVDLGEFNWSLAPTKEMTLKEIENELGYKIKVVDK